MNRSTLEALMQLDREPEDGPAFNAWLGQRDVVPFLEQDAADDDIIVYAALDHVFIHAILIPAFEVTAETVAPLLDWNFNACGGWSLTSSRDDVTIEPPLAMEHPPLIQAGEKIVFLRGFDGVPHKSSYFELSQQIAHVLGLHHLEERDAWCRLNRVGDIDEIVKLHKVADGKNVVSMRKDELAWYAGAGECIVLRTFDFTRFRLSSFSGWHAAREPHQLTGSETVFGKLTLSGTTGSYSRGVQLLDIAVPKAQMLRRLFYGEETEKQYATFIAHDWRHRTIGEFSCDPKQLANYFVPSPHPFETTPAFFRPEVLSKYKADSEKYSLEHRSVSCRGGWYLKSIGVNDAGQVHAYLGYLGNLPYEEQLHWKQFNEPPKAGLSEGVITTDFDGDFSDEYDPLIALKQKLHALEKRHVPWWTLRDESLPNRVHYPLTDARDEWASELMNLDQLLVEGLVEKWLRTKATELGRNPDARLRPLKLLEECLCGLGFEETHARQLMSPWHAVHNLRSELKGHASNTEGRKHEIAARKAHESLINHFRQLCQQCDESLTVIMPALEPSANSQEPGP